MWSIHWRHTSKWTQFLDDFDRRFDEKSSIKIKKKKNFINNEDFKDFYEDVIEYFINILLILIIVLLFFILFYNAAINV